MNKFDIIEAGQRLNKCVRDLDKSMALLDRSAEKGVDAFNNLSEAVEKINLTTDYLQIELREVI